MSPSRRADMFVDPEQDPREGGPTLGDERTTLVEYLRIQRATLELKWRAGGALVRQGVRGDDGVGRRRGHPAQPSHGRAMLYGRWDDAIAAHAAADVK